MEFNINVDYRHQFGKKYREEKENIEKILKKDVKKSEDMMNLFLPIIDSSVRSNELMRLFSMIIDSDIIHRSELGKVKKL